MTPRRAVPRWPALFVALTILFVACPAIAHEVTLAAADAAGEARNATGVVHAFVVDNPGRGTSTRHVELMLDDGTSLPLEGPIAETAVIGARVQASGITHGKALVVSSVVTVAPGRGAPKASVEAEGTLRVLHADDFANGRSHWIYELHDNTGHARQLRIGSLPGELAPGTRIRVLGRPAANDASMLDPERITVLAEPTSALSTTDAVAKAATANSVLVILANFNDTTAPSFSSAQMQQVMTSNTDSVANFFREASYGQQIMNVTVTPGWVTMNLALPSTCGSTDWQGIASAAEAGAKKLGTAYDPAAYNFVVYVFTNVPACGWLGLGYIGSPHKAWINGTNAARTSAIAHEMGHNFGLLHAGSLRCGGSIGGTCSVSEYGDPFDTMGNKSAMHYNAMQKAKLGWIPSATVSTYAGGSAQYTLSPIESAGGSTYAVRVPTASSKRTYWVEFRQPIGFDAGLASVPNNGAQVRVAAPLETLCSGCDSWSDDTQLVDMTPSTTSFSDAALVAGSTFTDPTYGINISVLAASANALTVQVSTGTTSVAPTPAATTTSLASSANPAIAGALTTFTASVSGSNPTGSVKFTDNGTAIADCAAVALSGSGNARSASCATNAFLAGAHSIVAAYTGDSANLPSSATLGQNVTAPVNGTNVALASNGGVASASSTLGPSFAASTIIDNRRSGANWGNYGGWADATQGAYPDWIQVDFNGAKTIDHVVVYSVQDDYLNPVEPTDTMTGTRFVVSSFDVQGWDGSSWVTLASVTGNTRIKRTVSFASYTTDRLRIVVDSTQDGTWSRITQVEAWSSATFTSKNYALSANGGVASASSTLGPSFPVSTIVDNSRSGANWGLYAGWADATKSAYPDWVQIDFNGTRTIDHVILYSVQDNYLSPVEPTDTMTGTRFVVSSFDVQAWTGSAWTTVASVSGNNLVKRTAWFPAYATNAIRIVVNSTQDGAWSRITEVEAWGR
jgi:hypothetical protein